MQPSAEDATPRGALTGITVIELASIVMAPYACQVLGDLGADVIRIEDQLRPDPSRSLGGGPHPELSGIALNLHRNKRSIQLDLQSPRDRAIADRLLDRADVFVTNMRPKALAKLGLDAETVMARRDHLIYCETHGFSLESGDADLPAFDDIVQAATGVPGLVEAVTGRASFMPAIFADKIAGLTIVYSVLAALLHRALTGEAQRVEVPMFDSVLSFNLVEHLAKAAVYAGEPGYSRILTKQRGPHRTKDGYIALLPYSNEDWFSLYRAVGHADELEQPCFQSHNARQENAAKVYASLGRILRERTTAEWLDLAAELGIPAGPVVSLADIVADQRGHRGMLTDHVHPVAGPYRRIGVPSRFSKTPMTVRREAPLLGQDTDDILGELGLLPDESQARRS
jgi:crotonobetainyl-CoA:carnitine CoA-transferase CaiB-like acyl-CoA transferase